MNKYRLAFAFGLLCIISALFIFGRQRQPFTGLHYSVSDSRQEYKIKASYNSASSGKVGAYLNNELGSYTDISFTGTELDAEITLENEVSFYIRHKPGKLQITLDKRKNSPTTYEKFRRMGRELKDVMSLP